MKKLKLIFLSLIVLFTLSGCFKSTATMTINKDKSMRFQATYLVTKQLASLNDLDKSAFTKKGLNVTDVENDSYVGFDVSKDYKNIDDLSNETGKEVVISDFTEESFDDSIFFKVKKGFFKNTYTANFKYDFNSKESPVKTNSGSEGSTGTSDASGSNVSKDDDDIEEVDYTKLLALSNEMEVKFIVNLPSKNISNNASVVDNDGKRLTWNLTPNLGSLSSSSITGGNSDAALPNSGTDSTGSSNVMSINYSFSMLNMGTIYLVGGIGAVILITVIIVVTSKMKKKRNEELGIGVSKFANEPSPEIDPNKTINQMINASANINLGVSPVNSNAQPQVNNSVTPQVGVQPQVVTPVQQAQVVQPALNNAVPVGDVQQVQPTQTVQVTQPVQTTEQVVQAVNPVTNNNVQQVVPNTVTDTNSQVINPVNLVDNNASDTVAVDNVAPIVNPEPAPVVNQNVAPVTNQEVVQNQIVNPVPTQVSSTPVVNQVVQDTANVSTDTSAVSTVTPQVQPNNVVSNEVVNNPVNNENVQ